MTFEQRLLNYANRPAAKKNQRPDGLSKKQYKRLIKKLNHQFALAE